MCFSTAASKIPKGDRMPKLTVLVDLDPIVRVNHVRALPWTCSLEEGAGCGHRKHPRDWDVPF